MTQIVAASKLGVNVLTATNPNDFIFHSLYNSFKILAVMTASVTLNGSSTETFSVAHGQSFIPSCYMFSKRTDTANVYSLGTFTSTDYDSYYSTRLYADSSNIYVRMVNLTSDDKDLTLIIYLFETQL